MQDVLDPAWSPDGHSIAVIAVAGRGGYQQVMMVNVRSGAIRALTTDPRTKSFPQWSPSGGQVAFVGAAGIWMISVQSRRERMMLPGVYSSLQWTSAGIASFGAG